MEEDREIRCLHATGEDWEEKDIMSTWTSVSWTHHLNCNLSILSWVQFGIDSMHAAYNMHNHWFNTSLQNGWRITLFLKKEYWVSASFWTWGFWLPARWHLQISEDSRSNSAFQCSFSSICNSSTKLLAWSFATFQAPVHFLTGHAYFYLVTNY